MDARNRQKMQQEQNRSLIIQKRNAIQNTINKFNAKKYSDKLNEHRRNKKTHKFNTRNVDLKSQEKKKKRIWIWSKLRITTRLAAADCRHSSPISKFVSVCVGDMTTVSTLTLARIRRRSAQISATSRRRCYSCANSGGTRSEDAMVAKWGKAELRTNHTFRGCNDRSPMFESLQLFLIIWWVGIRTSQVWRWVVTRASC